MIKRSSVKPRVVFSRCQQPGSSTSTRHVAIKWGGADLGLRELVSQVARQSVASTCPA